jgi:hypothetical protein
MVAGERRRPAASSNGSGMIPPRALKIAPSLLPATSVAPAARSRPPPRGRADVTLLARTAVHTATDESSSAASPRLAIPGAPSAWNSIAPVAPLPFGGSRSDVGADRASADAWSSSAAGVSFRGSTRSHRSETGSIDGRPLRSSTAGSRSGRARGGRTGLAHPPRSHQVSAGTAASQKSSLRPVEPLTTPRSARNSSSNGSVCVPP